LKQRTAWQVQKSVVYALFLREVSVRFSAGRLGYFWVIFEPLMQIFIFVLVKMLLFGTKSPLDYSVFITIGFVAFNLFRHILDRSMSAFEGNKGLYAYKQVKPIDGLIARILVEILITMIIATIFVAMGFYLDRDMNVENIGMVILGFLWLIVFSFGIGLFISVIGIFFNSFLKVVRLVLSPLMFVSAIFYSMQNMPQALQQLLYYNPLAHFIEMIHDNYFFVLNDSFIDYEYMLIWTIMPLYIGLWLYRKLEKGIISV